MYISREQLRNIIFYEYKSGISETQCLENLNNALGTDISPSRATIYRWYAEFRKGRNSCIDEQRSGRPNTAVTKEIIAAVKKMIEENPKCSYSMLEHSIGIGSSSVKKILHAHLNMKKVNGQWLAKQ